MGVLGSYLPVLFSFGDTGPQSCIIRQKQLLSSKDYCVTYFEIENLAALQVFKLLFQERVLFFFFFFAKKKTEVLRPRETNNLMSNHIQLLVVSFLASSGTPLSLRAFWRQCI
jgi:hypothetical protein